MARSWPLLQCLADFTAGPPTIAGGGSVDLLAPASGVALRTFTTSRGRQYELGTVQAGTLDLGIDDPSEKLNPVNSGSAWNSGSNSLLPYRAVQLSAWWNTTTKDVSGNFLNSTNLVSGSNTIHFDPSFESSVGGWFATVGSPALTTSTLHHLDGAQSMRATFNAGTDQIALSGPSVVPGMTYTASLSVWCPTGSTVTFTFANNAAGFPVIGSATSTVVGNWQRLTVTGVPTSTYVVFLVNLTTGTPPVQMWIDQTQLELGSSFSSFTTVGPTNFDLFTGYVERYPQQWADQGKRGKKPLQAVDALSPLSRTIIRQSYAPTVLADSPSLYIPYDDESFPQTILLPQGGQPGTGYQQLGINSGAVTFSGDTFPDGTRTIAIAQPNTNPVTGANGNMTTWIGTYNVAALLDPSSFTMEFWYRWNNGSVAVGAATMQPGETTVGQALAPQRPLFMYNLNNFIAIQWIDNSGVTRFIFGLSSLGQPLALDGKWHHIVISLANISGTYSYRWAVDGGTVTAWTALSGAGTPPVQFLNNFFANASGYWGDPASTIAVANHACYGSALSQSQITAHYKRGAGYFGEKSGTRALRLLTQYWSSNVVTDTGETSMAQDFSYDGRSILDVLQEIADTEGGLVWADASGFVHQDSRESRYTAATSTTSQFTFGENAGELPYTSLSYDYDPTYVYSQANFTAGGSGNQLAPVVNASSQTAYGQRILSKTLQMAVDWDVNQAAQFYVQRYAKPAGAPGTGTAPRISGMTLDPGANPDLWAAVLALDIGWRVTVKRRTAAGVTISGDYYVEQISHNNAGDSWKVTYQLSPVFVSQAWVLGDAVKGVLGSTTVCVY